MNTSLDGQGQGTISLAAAAQFEASKQKPKNSFSRHALNQPPQPVQMPIGNLSNLRLTRGTESPSSSASSSLCGNSGQFFANYNSGYDPSTRGYGVGVSPFNPVDINASGSTFSRNSSCFSAMDTNPGMFNNTLNNINPPISAEEDSYQQQQQFIVNKPNPVPFVPNGFYENNEDEEDDDNYTQVSPRADTAASSSSSSFQSVGGSSSSSSSYVTVGIKPPTIEMKIAVPQIVYTKEKDFNHQQKYEQNNGKEVVKLAVPLSERDALKVFARSKFVNLREAVDERGNELRKEGEKLKTVYKAKSLLDAGNECLSEGLKPDARALMAALKISRAIQVVTNLMVEENGGDQQSREFVPSFKYKKEGFSKLEESIGEIGRVKNSGDTGK